MQANYLIEVSFKSSALGGFKQIVAPLFVSKDQALAMVHEYGVYKGICGIRHGMAMLYSIENVFPFVRLLILNNAADLKSSQRIVDLLDEVAPAPTFLYLDQVHMAAKSA